MRNGSSSSIFDRMTTTGGQALVRALLRNGVRDIFFIPGIQLDWAVDALRQHALEINRFVPRHEQSTTYMADGYSRVSGKPGVAMVVPGPGVLNAGAGLATAYACNSRVLFLAAQIHSAAIGRGYGQLHEIQDQSGLISGLTKWHVRVRDQGEITAAVDRAFQELHSERPRPVGIELPYDILSAECAAAAEATVSEPRRIALNEAEIARAAMMIDRAKFPVFYVGGGVLAPESSTRLRTLAEKLGAPVVMSESGRGALPEHHPLAMTTLSGRPLFEVADLVVVVGSRFMDIMHPEPAWSDERIEYIHVNIDASDFTAPRHPTLTIRADAAEAMGALTDAVSPREVLTASQAQKIKQWAQVQIDRVTPQAAFIRALRAALPEDGIFVNELTQVGYLARVAFPVLGPRTYISPGYQGTLGYALPTALGAAVGSAGKRVLAISGDGGLGWSLQELATARRYSLRVTLVVFSDGYFGNVRAIQRRVFGAEEAVDLVNPDFQLLAKAFGIPGVRASTPGELEGAVRASIDEDGPVLIEVPVGEMSNPWHLLRLKPMRGLAMPDVPPNPLQ